MKSQDYLYGHIEKDGVKVVEIIGNYMGYLDFDGVRYWDIRDKEDLHFPPRWEDSDPNSLLSDAKRRTDRIFLEEKPIEEAQAEKERLEELQRHDRKLREKCDKRRAEGGAKFAFLEKKE